MLRAASVAMSNTIAATAAVRITHDVVSLAMAVPFKR
jgi:hypothetical protein